MINRQIYNKKYLLSLIGEHDEQVDTIIKRRLFLLDKINNYDDSILADFKLNSKNDSLNNYDDRITNDRGITAVILSYNEERCITRCIESIITIFDEINVIDTGSMDKTIFEVRRINSQKIKIFNYSWQNDFSAARNYGISKATNDWVMFVDADEMYNGELDYDDFHELISIFDVEGVREKVYFSYLIKEKSTSQYYDDVPRGVWKKGNCKYFGNVHEEIRMPEGDSINIKLDMLFIHDGYDSAVLESKNKIERNMLLLQCMILKEPQNLRWEYFYLRDGIDEIELEEFKKRVLSTIVENPNKSLCRENIIENKYVFNYLNLYCKKLLLSGIYNNYNEIAKASNIMIAMAPDNSDAFFYKIVSDITKQQGIMSELLMSTIKFRKRHFGVQNNTISPEGYHIDLLLAILLFENMKFNESKKYFELIEDKSEMQAFKEIIENYMKAFTMF